MFYIAGPGHGGPALVANTHLEGTYSEIYPDISQDKTGLKPLLVDAEHPDHLKQLESWLKSYKPEELFDENGRLITELADLAPKGKDRECAV